MCYKPGIASPIFFAYNSSDQTITDPVKLNIDSSLYAGSLSDNELTHTEKSASMADVRYSMGGAGRRSFTNIRTGSEQSVSKGFNLNGSGGGASGVSDELSYATFDPSSLQIFCNSRFSAGITLKADFTRLTGVLIS